VHKTHEISSIMEHSENENIVMIKENDEKEILINAKYPEESG